MPLNSTRRRSAFRGRRRFFFLDPFRNVVMNRPCSHSERGDQAGGNSNVGGRQCVLRYTISMKKCLWLEPRNRKKSVRACLSLQSLAPGPTVCRGGPGAIGRTPHNPVPRRLRRGRPGPRGDAQALEVEKSSHYDTETSVCSPGVPARGIPLPAMARRPRVPRSLLVGTSSFPRQFRRSMRRRLCSDRATIRPWRARGESVRVYLSANWIPNYVSAFQGRLAAVGRVSA
jgi:hypothetical protein